ncbi:MAG TPA: GTPase ObgE [Candidatus Saccharimonadales bacterium]|nr:GTPase ObgE [Candidatus Saccharimonadales bacterium]
MIFVDKVNIKVRAGDGGNGKLSFRHEKFIAKGGPDGGDGGNGGSVIFRASNNQNTLTAFRYQKEVKAESGHAGDKRRKHGKTGQDLIIEVPVGTLIVNEDGEVVADLTENHQQAVAAKGGKGGFGNAHFVSSTRQAPNFAEKGEPGEAFTLTLELKMIADVGLVGLPNAGKSTLLSKISHARPEIADYPFTTLTPNLGVVDIDKSKSILVADIPGLIEGAAEGKGLGHDFLRHIERTHVILHLIDSYNEDVAKVYTIIRSELEAYEPRLIKRPEVVALTKIEGLDDEIIKDLVNQLQRVTKKGTIILPISAFSGQNLNELVYTLEKKVVQQKAKKVKPKVEDEIPVIKLADTTKAFKIKKDGTAYLVSGQKIEQFARRTDFSNDEAVLRLKDIMRKQGIIHELLRRGIKANQTIRFPDGQQMKF